MIKRPENVSSGFSVEGDPKKSDCPAPSFFATSTVASKLISSHLLKGCILIVHECVVTQHN